MARSIFITGGARSGKSRFAEQITRGFGGSHAYLATAQPLDGEMGERISKHQQRRGDSWQTIEEPLQLSQALTDNDGIHSAILVDCLTLWISNLLFHYEVTIESLEERILGDVEKLAETLGGMRTPVIIVSNEVGMGIVPEHRLGRLFRDIAGQANQIVAAAAGEAWLVASGIPLRLK